ncbi:hypothetical protein GQF42_42460 [Streptomyces broussonetiae]|uniref:Uncharacterized protein n=1 Tax=Streptomyces broussonetiae TaxID=2686304 RepID=A0A6I6NDT3_9ACTN|nr:hypothetical protein GQF42_42460 [Streptomyces broussonetiae]
MRQALGLCVAPGCGKDIGGVHGPASDTAAEHGKHGIETVVTGVEERRPDEDELFLLGGCEQVGHVRCDGGGSVHGLGEAAGVVAEQGLAEFVRELVGGLLEAVEIGAAAADEGAEADTRVDGYMAAAGPERRVRRRRAG